MGGNIFDQMAAEQPQAAPTTPTQPSSAAGAVDYEKLSNTAVGEKKKYIRADLNNQTVVIKSAQLFNGDLEDKESIVDAANGKGVKYVKCNFIVAYDTPNEDREYYSGAIQFIQKDGSLSEHSLWYEGATNQVASLWEAVAKFKNKDPKDLSPREFLAFLNNKPKAVLVGKTFRFPGSEPSKKNMVDHFVA